MPSFNLHNGSNTVFLIISVPCGPVPLNRTPGVSVRVPHFAPGNPACPNRS